MRPKVRFASIIGSYGWAGKMAEIVKAAMPNLKVELLPPVIAKGLPKPADLEAIDKLAEAVARKHAELGLLTEQVSAQPGAAGRFRPGAVLPGSARKSTILTLPEGRG